MKIFNDDNSPDYFLHNFGSKPEQTAAAPAAGDDGGNGGGDSRQFSFGPQTPATPPGRRHRWRRRMAWVLVILVLLLGATFYIRYYVPHTSDSRVRGYVTAVEKRGILFHTWEAEMISQSQLTDTTHIYTRDVVFSIPDDSLARILANYQGTGRPITVVLKRYYGTLPWRGATNTILTDIIK